MTVVMQCLTKYLLVISCLCAGGVERAMAQQTFQHLDYEVRYKSGAYQPLEGGVIIRADQFVNFSGAVDPDDGTALNIPIGFNFEYNGRRCNSVNVNVNGWVSINPVGQTQEIPLTPAAPNGLFVPMSPNNTLAVYWGNHYYRFYELGRANSRITYLTTFQSSGINPHPGIFNLEWRNLNVNSPD